MYWVIDEEGSRKKLTQLAFEDFLEAIVRLCGMKAMPLDADIQQGGYADAVAALTRHGADAIREQIKKESVLFAERMFSDETRAIFDKFLNKK